MKNAITKPAFAGLFVAILCSPVMASNSQTLENANSHFVFETTSAYRAIADDWLFAGDLVEGRIRVQAANEKWGYVDAAGNIIVAPHYDDAGDFSHAFAAVRLNNGWSYIDSFGQVMLPFNQTAAFLVRDNKAVTKNHKNQLIAYDTNSWQVVECDEKCRSMLF